MPGQLHFNNSPLDFTFLWHILNSQIFVGKLIIRSGNQGYLFGFYLYINHRKGQCV